jgi:hypothetical protein
VLHLLPLVWPRLLRLHRLQPTAATRRWKDKDDKDKGKENDAAAAAAGAGGDGGGGKEEKKAGDGKEDNKKIEFLQPREYERLVTIRGMRSTPARGWHLVDDKQAIVKAEVRSLVRYRLQLSNQISLAKYRPTQKSCSNFSRL